MFGLKGSLPAGFLQGPFFLDMNLLFTTEAPGYYEDIGVSAPSGNILLFDTLLVFHIDNFLTRSTSIYLGAGPILAYSSFSLETVDGSSFVSEEIRVGATFMLGFGHRLGPVVVKLEPRYHMEKTNYFSVLAGAQYTF